MKFNGHNPKIYSVLSRVRTQWGHHDEEVSEGEWVRAHAPL